jgi:hypothetical protein
MVSFMMMIVGPDEKYKSTAQDDTHPTIHLYSEHFKMASASTLLLVD